MIKILANYNLNFNISIYHISLLKLPMELYKRDDIQESKAKVVKSPKDAAIGVATLSGLMFMRLENRITATIITPSRKLAIDAVSNELAQRTIP